MPGSTLLPLAFPANFFPSLISFATPALAYGHQNNPIRLRQLFALRIKNLHAYDAQDHAYGICIWPANHRKKQKVIILY